ncbi:MAG: DnaJ C-terminal domain-containing protein [Hyphomonadaceae bacterium]|nr:DnaJ C-terminal domain-containing protein [Hyphomonadaceae bacterium]
MTWDPYAALGIKRSAGADDIRSAYRKLAKELHPDVRPGDKQAEDRFKRATAAFNLLSDPALRSRYDKGEIDADGNEKAVFSSRPHARAGAGPEAAFDLGDIFSDFFSAGGAAGGPRGFGRMRGRDLRYALEIDFLDAVKGARRRIQLDEGRTLEVAIPPGVESGRTLRLKSQGGAGAGGGPPGDALVEVTVKPHTFFRREGTDIHMDLPISLTEAVEGAKVQAPTVFGPVSITVPAGANTGMVLRLKGKGVGGTGDQLVRLLVMLPETPDDDLKKFVKKWSRRDQAPPRPLQA